MRQFTAFALAFSMTFSAAPLFAAQRAPRRDRQAEGASLAGTATSSTGQTIANVTVQLRDLVTGSLAGTTTSTATGTFTFVGIQAGTYAIEVVSAVGQIVGTSAAIAVTAGATITGVAVSATAAIAGAAAAGAGAAAGVAAAGAGAGAASGVSTAVVVTTAAAAAGVVGAVAIVQNNASPSR